MPRPSIRWWYCVQASGNESPVCATSAPAPEPQRVGRAERVGVEAGAGADVAGARAAVPEVHGDAVVGMSGHREDRRPDRAALVLELDDVAVDLCRARRRGVAGELSALSLSAVAGLTMTALSHVSLVIGLGSSCSQPLLAKRPS